MDKFSGKQKPEIIVTEDSNSGYEFYSAVCNGNGIACTSAGGKSNLKTILGKMSSESVLVIADGAAIGSEMNELYQLMRTKTTIQCYLPESFEWVVLKSGAIDGKAVQDILNHPEDFIESWKYFSWERYFTALLVEYTQDSYLKYSKSKLNEAYLHEKIVQAILNVMEGVNWQE